MPAKSIAQQQAAGAALAAKEKGTTSGLKGASKEMAKMSKKELEKIASTKHKGKPKHVKKKKLKEGIEPIEEAAGLASNIEFWVVEKAMSPQDNPLDLYYKSSPLSFGNQMIGGLLSQQIYGFYSDETAAENAAHDQVEAVVEAAKNLEEKKMQVTSKIEEVIKKMQKEINSCLEEGSDESMLKAETMMQKIKELRMKGKVVEASKKPVEEPKED